MSALTGQFDDADDSNNELTVIAKSIGHGVTNLPPPSPKEPPQQSSTKESPRKQVKATKPMAAPLVRSTKQTKFASEDDYCNDDYDDDEDNEDGDFGGLEASLMGEKGVGGGGSLSAALEKSLTAGKMNLDQRMVNDLASADKLAGQARAKHQGRDDRATSEQVMDPRTRLMLFKLLNSGFLSEIDGCLSTGKEANVYYAKAGEKGVAAVARNGAASFHEFAVKVFKTSILVFKDRDKYVSGEYRFRNGYCRSNPRKMVKTWAEKEMRNLRRLHNAGIPSPEPVVLKNHILVMEFIGTDGWPAPRLKDAGLSDRKMAECYWQCVKYMRKMYVACKLVHGDLSEYNMLYHEASGGVVFIDVSQSVEHDHPRAHEFLRKDCANVNAFFGKGSRGALQPMSTIQLFDFITDDARDMSDAEEDARLAKIADGIIGTRKKLVGGVIVNCELDVELEETEEEKAVALAAVNKQLVEEAVFMSMDVPRSLSEVQFPEEALRKLQSGEREEAYVHAVQNLLLAAPRSKGGSSGGGVEEEDEEDGKRQQLSGKTQPSEKRIPRPVLLARRKDETADHTNKESAAEGTLASPKELVLETVVDDDGNCGDDGEDAESDLSGSDQEDEDDEDGGANLRKLGWEWDGDPNGRLPPAGSTARLDAKAAKKAESKRIKEEQREKRKSKLSKHLKKSAVKSSGVKGNKSK
eukprot:CAMPEP_0171776060 /NCGR_PEP_ID=MMETSP0991-20121206/56915_1 /TAXON_ID=483369 /ORGANISM="non described non described, Strain CCMP2098" /LENGTH=693 /DNA_ID=CAMNT_0012382419 /DNA_START=8 /DNA_END=2089 /DNA_ORIENTATION=-